MSAAGGGHPPNSQTDWSALRFAVAFLTDHRALSVRQQHLTMDELAALIQAANSNAAADGKRSATDVAKALLGWLKLGVFGNVATGKGSLRHDGNILVLTGIEADYDGMQLAFDDAVMVLRQAGLACLIYTSPSYTAERPKWRVLCPFANAMLPAGPGEDSLQQRRGAMVSRLNGLFGANGIFATESWTLSQAYYYGATNGNPQHRAVVIEGTPIDLLDFLAPGAVGKPGTKASKPKPRLATDAGERVDPPEAHAGLDVDEQIRLMTTDFNYHVPQVRLAGYWIAQGVGTLEAMARLRAIMHTVPEDKRDERWQARLDEVPRNVEHAVGKEPFKKALAEQERAARREARERAMAALQGEDVDAGRPVIELIPGLTHLAATAACNALAASDLPIFQRGTELVLVTTLPRIAARTRERFYSVGVIALTEPMMSRALARAARFVRISKTGATVTCDPPHNVITQVLTMVGEWPQEPLTSVISTPTMRDDGTILSTPGYDAYTGNYLHEPPPMPTVGEHPTFRDAVDGLKLLNDLLVDFPFVTPTSRSVAMSLLMTPVLRSAISDEGVPLHLISAPTYGSGKSYLSDVASVIATGQVSAGIILPEKEDETEKRLVSAVLDGDGIISLDNCTGHLLSHPFLATMISQPRVRVRRLGSSARFEVANRQTVTANGNNLGITKDLTRRTVQVLIDPKTDDTTKRTYRGDPVAIVLRDRGKYVHAILTIARAYVAAGYPAQVRPLPSFGTWSKLICGALVWMGWPNPIDSQELLFAEDPERLELRMVFEAFPAGAHTTPELIALALDNDGIGPTHPDWLEACKLVATRGRELSGLSLGNWLRAHRDQYSGTLRLHRGGSANYPTWAVIGRPRSS